jgi:hypothetical protein
MIPDPTGAHPIHPRRPFQDGDPPHLLAYLATVPDPRAARGRRHPLIAILAIAAAAVLAGARSVTAIAGGPLMRPTGPGRAGLRCVGAKGGGTARLPR